MNEVLEVVNPVLVTLSSLIIIIGSLVTIFRRKVRESSLFLYETQIKRRNGIEIHRKTENQHLIELRNENERLRNELQALRIASKPLSFWQRVLYSMVILIMFPLVMLLMLKVKMTSKKQ